MSRHYYISIGIYGSNSANEKGHTHRAQMKIQIEQQKLADVRFGSEIMSQLESYTDSLSR